MLIQKLVEKKIITVEQAEALEKELKENFQGTTEEDFLLLKRILSEEDLNKIKAEIYDLPVFEDTEDLSLPIEVLSLVPEESARFYKVIPLGIEDDNLKIGIVNPEDIKAKEALTFLARQQKYKLAFYLINARQFEKYIKQYRSTEEEVGKALDELEVELKGEKTEADMFAKLGENEPLMEEAPIIKMVGVILRHAVDGKASDIHIEPEEKQLRIRFRMDGVLYSSLFLPIHTHPSIVARIKILCNMRIDETRIPQDGRFSAKIDTKEVDFRVSSLPTKLGEKIVIRVLDPSEGLRTYEEIGMTGINIEILKEAMQKPFGMILATGPTGSGKTTTLYSILRELNNPEYNVITLEDPIEYFIAGVNQSQVRPDIGYDFSQGLRSVVRQDPDIIMVGEIRDEESASLGVQAALTGHVVLSSLHTNNAIGVVPRLIDMKIKPFLLPASLNISIAQRLALRLCPYCKEKIKPNKEIEKMLLKEIAGMPERAKKDINLNDINIYKPVGCAKCNMKGEKGRVGVFEILKMTPELEAIIIEEPTELRIMAEAKRQGMVTMKQDGILKVLAGEVSLEEVLRVTD